MNLQTLTNIGYNKMKNKIIGIIDEPNPKGNEDTLDIFKHATALTKFIKHTSTPMTIGIQGEWGSGKTSLLNSIYHALENESKYKQIWVNSWEHSLLTTPEEALLKIMNEIIQEMLSVPDVKIQKNEIIKVASNIFKGALRIGATAVGGGKAGEVAEELLDNDNNTNPIKELRKKLDELAEQIKEGDSQYEKIIIYVDDLDRIEPKDAVRILELLKNIFSIPNCVFVLAIDYQVVVKGLEDKFGKRTEENEWEFRAFFDKIIQLPFMMPMGQYNIGKYVGSLLKQIGFVEDENRFIKEIEKVISYTIGGNPRSLKRLINSLALINIFSKIDHDSESNELDDKDENTDKDEMKDRLLFSLVCLQISYPVIYDLLTENPNFPSWNEDLAFEITQKKEEGGKEQEREKFKTDLDIATKTDLFNDEWEQVIYRICYTKPRYKSRVKDISQYFNYLKDELLKKYKEDKLKNIIAEVINETAVTNVSSTDESQKRTARKIPTWQKIQEIFMDIGKDAIAQNELIKQTSTKNPELNPGTIRCQIYKLTVNNRTRTHYGENEPRLCDGSNQYDFLFKNKDDTLTRFDKKKHGTWEIFKREDGKLDVSKIK